MPDFIQENAWRRRRSKTREAATATQLPAHNVGGFTPGIDGVMGKSSTRTGI